MKRLAIAAAMSLVAGLAQAQPQPSLDQQVDQARLNMLLSQAQFYQLLAQQKQVQINEASQREAAKDRWWADYVKGLAPVADKTAK